MNIDEVAEFERHIASLKANILSMRGNWYPYSSLANFQMLNEIVPGGWIKFQESLVGTRIADIGAADGLTSFFLEKHGIDVDIIDHAQTNFNGLRGARELKTALNSPVKIYDIDLDSQFHLPNNYEFTLLLGILYHLKNPFYILEQLARTSKRIALSTRIFSHNVVGGVMLRDIPVAYLVGPDECNNDPTNYWMLSRAGLQRILERSGWNVKGFKTFGATDKSDPFSSENDERAFVYAESRFNAI